LPYYIDFIVLLNYLFKFLSVHVVAGMLQADEHCVSSCPNGTVVSADHQLCVDCDGPCPSKEGWRWQELGPFSWLVYCCW